MSLAGGVQQRGHATCYIRADLPRRTGSDVTSADSGLTQANFSLGQSKRMGQCIQFLPDRVRIGRQCGVPAPPGSRSPAPGGWRLHNVAVLIESDTLELLYAAGNI